MNLEEPWRISRPEYAARYARGRRSADQPEIIASWSATHKHAVESAIKDGKRVPAHVLAEYPDLVKKYNDHRKAKPIHEMSDMEFARWIVGRQWPRDDSRAVEFGGLFIPEKTLFEAWQWQRQSKELCN